MSNSFSPCPYCGDLWLDEQVEERNRNGIGCPNCGPRLLVVKDSLTACHNTHPKTAFPTADAVGSPASPCWAPYSPTSGKDIHMHNDIKDQMIFLTLLLVAFCAILAGSILVGGWIVEGMPWVPE